MTKICTSIEQSKKLAEILPLESADMTCFQNQNGSISYYGFPISQANKASNPIPCWSLATLLGVLPEGTRLLKSTNISSIGDTKYHCDCPKDNIDEWFDNPVDACVDMIMRLNKLKML